MNEPLVYRDALPSGARAHEFEFQQVLGRGGFGITYLGCDTTLEKTVAIKEYMPSDIAVRDADRTVYPKTQHDQEDYSWGLERFLEEAQTLARFDHPGIVRVHRLFEAHGTAYIVMEYLEGQTLSVLYRSEGVLTEDRLRRIMAPVLDALQEVHDAEFLHRDIKPGNILIRRGGTPVLIDFGAARAAIGRRSQNMTAIVTQGFSPIEQYTGNSDSRQGPWTDIYALGAVLYRGMTGKVPEDAPARIVEDRLVPTAQAVSRRYSKTLTDAVDWALQLRGEDRPQSVDQWCEVIERGKAPPRPSGPTAARPTDRHRRSGKGRWLAVLGVVLVLTVGGAAYWWDELAGPGSFIDTWVDLAAVDREQELAERVGMVRALLEEGRLTEARSLLEEARSDGLDAATHGSLESAVGEAEAARLVEECAGHGAADRLEEALGCYREVLVLQPGHEEASAEVVGLEVPVAWLEAKERDTVEGYYDFAVSYPGSALVALARSSLEELEPSYWEWAAATGTLEAYRRYLEVYPDGTFAGLAELRVSQAE